MSSQAGRASWPALVTIGFGGVLALYAAIMFFALEGWAFAALAISQVFIAFGVLSLARRLLKNPHSSDRGTAVPSEVS